MDPLMVQLVVRSQAPPVHMSECVLVTEVQTAHDVCVCTLGKTRVYS